MQRKILYDASADFTLQGFIKRFNTPIKDLIKNYIDNKPMAETRLTDFFMCSTNLVGYVFDHGMQLLEIIIELTSALKVKIPNPSIANADRMIRTQAAIGFCYLWKWMVAEAEESEIIQACHYCAAAALENNSLALFVVAARLEELNNRIMMLDQNARIFLERIFIKLPFSSIDRTDPAVSLATLAYRFGSTSAGVLLTKIFIEQPETVDLTSLVTWIPRECLDPLNTVNTVNEYLHGLAEKESAQALMLLVAQMLEGENINNAPKALRIQVLPYLYRAAELGSLYALADLFRIYFPLNTPFTDRARCAAYFRALKPVIMLGWDPEDELVSEISTGTDLTVVYHLILSFYPGSYPTYAKVRLWRLVQEDYEIFDQLSNGDDWAQIQSALIADPDKEEEKAILPTAAQVKTIFERKQHDLALSMRILLEYNSEISHIYLILAQTQYLIHPSYLRDLDPIIHGIDENKIRMMDEKIAVERKQERPFTLQEGMKAQCVHLKKLVEDNIQYIKNEIDNQLKQDYFNSLEEATLFRRARLTRIYDTPREQIIDNDDLVIKKNVRIMEAYTKLRAVASLYGFFTPKINADPFIRIRKFNERLDEIEREQLLKTTIESKGDATSHHTSLAPNITRFIPRARTILSNVKH